MCADLNKKFAFTQITCTNTYPLAFFWVSRRLDSFYGMSAFTETRHMFLKFTACRDNVSWAFWCVMSFYGYVNEGECKMDYIYFFFYSSSSTPHIMNLVKCLKYSRNRKLILFFQLQNFLADILVGKNYYMDHYPRHWHY